MSIIIYLLSVIVIFTLICFWVYYQNGKVNLDRNFESNQKIIKLKYFLTINDFKAKVIEKTLVNNVSYGHGYSCYMAVCEGINNKERFYLELPKPTIIVGDIVDLKYSENHFCDNGDGWNEGHINIIGKSE